MVHRSSTSSGMLRYPSRVNNDRTAFAMTVDLSRQHTELDARTQTALGLLDGQELTEALVDLVRLPSVHDPSRPDGNESAAAGYIEALLRSWDMPYTRREVAPGRPNLVVDLPGVADGPILVMEGHTDVVTAGDRGAWTIDPFAAEIRDGRLYGRGACDMKGGLAAMLFAARALQLAGSNYRGTLRLAVLADEEGMMLGARGFVADGYLDGVSAAIVCEPEGDRVCIAQKGAIRLRARFHGKMAHGCMPDEGVNPVTALGEAVVACRRLEQEILAECHPHQLLGRFSLTPTVALAGEPEQGNVIPALADLILDVRTTPWHDHPSIIDRVHRAMRASAATVDGISVDVEVMDDRPSTETDPDDPIVGAVIAAHEAETGSHPPFGGVPGSTDGTIFWDATRLPIVTYGPGETTLPHQADEWVSIDEVIRYARTYIAAVLRYFDAVAETGMEGRLGDR